MQKLNETDDVYSIVEEEEDEGKVIYHMKNGREHRSERDAFGNVLPAVIFPDGSAYWKIDGRFHRESDLPASIYLSDEDPENSGRRWFFHGLEHRDTKDPVTGLTNPSYISCDGTEMHWCINGVFQRESDLPAIVTENESLWYLDGEVGRANGLPAIEYRNGDRSWLMNSDYHRDGDEPAIVEEGGTIQQWYRYGKRHRDGDKPAVVRPDRLEWWVDGKPIRVEAR